MSNVTYLTETDRLIAELESQLEAKLKALQLEPKYQSEARPHVTAIFAS